MMRDYAVGEKIASSANARQEGGAHYKDRAIQLWDFLHFNKIGWLAGNVIKYAFRFDQKNGLEDLKKAKHYLDKLIETEEQKETR